MTTTTCDQATVDELYENQTPHCRYCAAHIEHGEVCGIKTEGLCDGGLICTTCLIERYPYDAAKALFGLHIEISSPRKSSTTYEAGDHFLSVNVNKDYKVAEVRNRNGKIKVY